jgi:hypothetical protein
MRDHSLPFWKIGIVACSRTSVGVVPVVRDLQVELLLQRADEVDLGQQVTDRRIVHAVVGGGDAVTRR